ncbi:unannotated protein [freshwater metagenome]|uniref:Unannotated protein n=1 Tax=freshwater metagenome TaxID=449393 RepID=A0A6J7K112_9ZZZZ
MDDDGPVGLEGLAQRGAQRRDVVAVDDADVRPVQRLPQLAVRVQELHGALELGADVLDDAADAREVGQAVLDALPTVPELRVQADALEVAGQRADVRRDRHAVVVQDHDERRAHAAGLVRGLEGDAAGHRAVADDGDDLAGLLRAVRVGLADPHALAQADAVADRRRRVAGAHDVVLGLVDRAERRHAVVLADRAELVAATREDLVRIGLVADVPEDLVRRAVEQGVQRDGDLARAEIGPEVAADLTDGVDDVLAHLLSDLLQLLLGEPVEVLRAIDAVQQSGHGSVSPRVDEGGEGVQVLGFT